VAALKKACELTWAIDLVRVVLIASYGVIGYSLPQIKLVIGQ
jgi:hypothetical protein